MNISRAPGDLPRRRISAATFLTAASLGAAVLLALLSVWPVLRAPQFGILDCPYEYQLSQRIHFLDIKAYLLSPKDANRCRIGYFIEFIPAWITTSAAFHYWYQTLVSLVLPALLVFWLLYRLTGQRWFALLGIVPLLCNSSFTEVYYTLLKSEPLTLTGALGATFLLWVGLYEPCSRSKGKDLLCLNLDWLALAGVILFLVHRTAVLNVYEAFRAELWLAIAGVWIASLVWWLRHARETQRAWACGIAFHLVAFVAAVLTYTIKETGGGFLGVYLAGLALLCWGSPLPLGTALKRTAGLTLFNLALFGVLVYFYLHLTQLYSVSGRVAYSTDIHSLIVGARRLGGHYLNTASYLIPGALILGLALLAYPLLKARGGDTAGLRARIAWTAYFFLFFLGMATPLVPWQDLDVRHYLVGAVGAGLAGVLATHLGIFLTGLRLPRALRVAALTLTAATALLLVANSVFTVVVGHLSEGRVRQRSDAAYDAMYGYIAAHTPKNGAAYFMMEPELPEVILNTATAMALFYQRPDIRCLFPRSAPEIQETGMIAVANISAVCNPNRIPVHAADVLLFNSAIRPYFAMTHRFDAINETPVWYADKNGHRGYQYAARCGIPAFWDLKRSVYTFGWNVYEITSVARKQQTVNLLANNKFTDGMSFWQPWNQARSITGAVRVVDGAVRIVNPRAKPVGVQQVVNVTSGVVYRLSGFAKSVGTQSASKIFGARIAFWLPPQPELQVLWLTHNDQWLEHVLIFTNQVSGTAIIYASLGYGNVPAEAEFTDIRFEKVTNTGP